MFLGYNTNGFAHHRLEDAIEILAELGYRGCALTLDVHHCDPMAAAFASRLRTHGRRLRELGLERVIETGARFLLDPRRKHQPTLLNPDPGERNVRLKFLGDCISNAGRDGFDAVVSFWSGTALDDASPAVLMQRLVEGCRHLAEWASVHEVRLAFEPEPGMFIDTMEKFEELHAKVAHPSFGLTLDVGHLICNGELPVRKHIQRWKHALWNVHLEDMKPSVHDHIFFGEGEVDFEDVFAGLKEVEYTEGVYVELSRHSHDAVNTARRAKAFLDRFVAR